MLIRARAELACRPVWQQRRSVKRITVTTARTTSRGHADRHLELQMLKNVRLSITKLAVIAGSSAVALGAVSALLSGEAQNRKEWLDYAGGPDGSRFMALKQITKAN